MIISADYSIFHQFIERYHPQRFEHISRLDPFMIDMEEELRNNRQFFYIADLIKVRILFTSWGSNTIIGLSPEQVDTSTFFVLAHPDDQELLNRAQAKLYKQGQELYNRENGISIVSVLIRERNGDGDYIDLVLQTYSFYSELHKTVFTLIAATEPGITNSESDGMHYYYAGDNPAMFRYPDLALLKEGYHFSRRELEILKLIAAGLSSEQIAATLFLSVNTVDTHRRHLLKKASSATTHDLVIQLRENGVL
jgi:DNA-binding CsgD family transcriptional regulator